MFTIPILGDGLPVWIHELAPPSRTLILDGRDRPEPVTRKTKQRATVSWYPGRSRASVQIMGTSEDPLILRGWFRDPLSMLNGGGPQGRRALVQGLLDSGNLCNLSWGDTVVGLGRITSAEFEIRTVTRIRYEIEFTFDQMLETVAVVPLPIAPLTATDLAVALEVCQEAIDAMTETVRTISAADALVAPLA